MAEGRTQRLLLAAAGALEDGRDPFEGPFLAQHSVTYDECMGLSDHLALGARIVAWALEHPREAASALDGAQFASASRRLAALVQVQGGTHG